MTKFESVLTQALELDEADREWLAIRLNMSLENVPAHDDAWAAELKRRIEEENRGEADLMDWEEFRKELMADPQ